MTQFLLRLAALGLLLSALAPAALAQVTATNGFLDPTAPEAHIRVEWTNGDPNRGTDIFYAEVVDGVVGTETYLGTTNSATGFSFSRDAQGIRPGVEYRFRLQRFDLIAGAMVPMGTAVGARVPLSPQTLDASEHQFGGVTLSWADRSTAELGYVLYRGAPGDDPTVAALTEIGRVAPNETTYLDATSEAYVPYQYCVGQLDRTSGVESTLEPLACDTGVSGPAFLASATAGGAPAPEPHVRLTWTPTGTPGELYEITRHRIPPGAVAPYPPGQLLAVRPEADSVYLDLGAVPGQDYRYCVRATATGHPAARPEACATGSRQLRRPSGFTASDSTRTDGVALRWTDRSAVETGFAVFRGAPGTPDGSMTRVATVGPDLTGYLDETADPLTAYRYCVGMLDASSGAAAVAEPLACDLGTRGAVLPPTGVAASDGTLADRVRIRWNAPAGATSFTVYRAAPGGTRQPLPGPITASPYDDLTAAEGVTYVYCVTASNADGESVAACDLEGGRRGGLAPPTAVAASDDASDGVVEVTWTDPGADETGFRIYRRPGVGDEVLVATVAANRTRYADNTAAPGEPYMYCVVSIATASVDGADVTSESGRPAGACDTGRRAALLAPAAFAAADGTAEGAVELTWESESEVVQLFRVVRDGAVLATLPPFARSYRDATALSGATYTYKVQSVTVVGVDPSAIRQGLAPVLAKAEADRQALDADRAQAAETGADAVARVDARGAATEAALVRDLRAQLAALGVDAAALGGATARAVGGLEIRDSAEDDGSRLLRTPGTLAATTTLEDRVRISWADRSEVETDYQVRAIYTPTDSVTVLVGPNRTEWVDVKAPAGAEVTYRVRAIDRDPAVADSGSPWATVVGGRVLATPKDVAAAQTAAETELLVTWTDASRAETEYTVTADLDTPWTGTAPANARQLRVPLQPADFGRPVAIEVRAVAPVVGLPGVPSQSAAATVTVTPTFLPPSVVTASTDYLNQVVVSWTDDSKANTGVVVRRNGSVLATLTTDATTYVDSAPIGAATYCVIPTVPGRTASEPAAVCAEGRTNNTTVPSTGDVVGNPVASAGFLEADAEYGRRVAADEGWAITGGPGDSIHLGRHTGPTWANPYRVLGSQMDPTGGYSETFRSDYGMASIYELTPAGWSEKEHIHQFFDFTYGKFGHDVDILGDVAIVGAPGPATFHTHPIVNPSPGEAWQYSFEYGDGGAYIYTRNSNGTWVQTGLLRGEGLPSNRFGDVTTSVHPTTFFAHYLHPHKGTVSKFRWRIFEYHSGARAYILKTDDNRAPTVSPVERFGEIVAINEHWAFATLNVQPGFPDGTPSGAHVPSIAWYRASDGYAWTGQRAGPPNFNTEVPGDLAASADVLAIGAPTNAGGVVHLHELSPTAVTETISAIITPPGGPVPTFGASVAVEGDVLAVGAPRATTDTGQTGAVYVYRRNSGGAWGYDETLVPTTASDTGFGVSVSLSGDLLTVGVEGENVVYAFRDQTFGWAEPVQPVRMTPDPSLGPAAADGFGRSVAATDDAIVIGAPDATSDSERAGAIYFASVSPTPGAVAASDGRYANRIQVRWDDQADAEDGYRVYRRGPEDSQHVLVGTLAPEAEVFDDFDVSPGLAYSYCVASYIGEEESQSNPLGESGRACDAGYTPPNGTISGRLATGEGAPVIGTGICLDPGLDQAVMFDGLEGRAIIPDFGALPDAFTIEAWINADSYAGGDHGISSIAGIESPFNYAVLRTGDSGTPSATVQFALNRNGEEIKLSGPLLEPGRWYHVAATYADRTMALYLDGQPVDTATRTAPIEDNVDGPFVIGQGFGRRPFDGRIDEVRVWSRALDAAEISDAFEDPLPLEGDETGLYTYWAIDQGTGRILTDLAGGGRHATLQGGAEWTREAAPLNTCALSNADGNYTFSGLRYGETTAFRVTPTDATRQFTPATRTATLTPESPTTNLVDFTDTSSYTVRGRVVHPFDPSDFPGQDPLPAPGVEILVDGQPLATTESDGTFAVAVRGARAHTFEARNDSLGLAFTAHLGGTDLDDSVATIVTEGDIEGLEFRNTTRRILRGQATGGCGFGIGPVTYRLYTEDRRFSVDGTTTGANAYVYNLPPLEYRLEFVSIGDVPAPISRTSVIDYFRNLGVLEADLRTEADTVDFRYRAPITLAIERGGAPFGDTGATCDTGFTVYDADANAERTLPNVPVIGEYERVPLTFRAYEDYGSGNECAVEAGTVRIFDGFADAADTPVEVELSESGTATYTTFGRSPDTFAGRTVGGVDRSYQKSLTAVLEVPDGPSVSTTEWAFVNGYREKPATFVTATLSEIPLMVLRDPPGSQSSAYIEEGTQSCVALSTVQTINLTTGVSAKFKLGFKILAGVFVLVENGFGVQLNTITQFGTSTETTTGPDSNIQICARTTERWQTSGDPSWTGEDIYTGVGLNLLFAEADVVTADAAECRVDLSTTLAAGLDETDPFETVFAYGGSHIEGTLIPELESLVELVGGDAAVEGEIDGAEAAIPLTQAILNWRGMLAHNDSLATEALGGEVENRSFSAGTSYSFGTTADTTWTSRQSVTAFLKTDNTVGTAFTIAGWDSTIGATLGFESRTNFTRTATDTETVGIGYTLADGDAGDYFTVDVAQDPRYGTYVFNTVSGASSGPWEPGTQKRDLPRLAIDPPVVDGVVEGERAVFTVSLTNASESDERREYVLAAPAELNRDGAVIRVNGAVLTERSYTVDARSTVSVPITVERGPLVDTYDLALVTYAPADLHRVAADTARFSVAFTPVVAPVRLQEPLDGWLVRSGSGALTFTLADIDLDHPPARLARRTVGVEARREGGGAWEPVASTTLAALVAAGEDAFRGAWDPDGFVDGLYEIRAFARSTEANGALPPYAGPPAVGRVDLTPPVVFGPPQPADGELALGETIGLTFEELVGCEALTTALGNGSAAVELVPQAGTAPVLQVGCADRTVLIAPADTSAWRALEGQRVTARVRGIPDIAGNPMSTDPNASAGWDRAWTFTVRRNAFGWTPAVVTVQAQPGIPTELPATLVNGRPQPVAYALVPNNPAFDPNDAAPATRPFVFTGPEDVYLTASGFSGDVVSGQLQPVGFRWPGAPVGTYSATVDVQSSDAGVALQTSPLTLTVEVSCAAPAWLAQASAIAPAFEHIMTVTADLRLAGGPSEPGDLLAAFVDGELRGAGAVAPVGGSLLAAFNVYGTGAPEAVTFQAWDASDAAGACTLYPTTDRVFEFAIDGQVGGVTPLVVNAPGAAGAPLEVALRAGWTWVSTNRAGTSPLGTALVGVGATANDLIQGQRAFSRYTPGEGWTNGLPGMDPGVGYHVYLDGAATMRHLGAPVDPAATPIELVAGWNWIGFLPATPLPLDQALASVTFAENDVIKGQDGYATYVDGFGWIGSGLSGLETLKAGVGYHLSVVDDATLTYPASPPAAGAVPASARAPRPVRRLDKLPETPAGDRPRRQIAVSDGPGAAPPSEAPADGPAVATAAAASSTAVLPTHEHTMIVTATLDGAPEGLHVAAYAVTDDGPQLRGLAPVEHVEVLGAPRAFLLAGGASGEAFALRPVLVTDSGDLVPVGELRFEDGSEAAFPFERDAVRGTAATPLALVLTGGTALGDEALPTEVGLSPTRPNPLSGPATFAFALPQATAVRLVVYDVLGREVAVLADGDQPAGRHEVRFDGRALASGTYVARLTAGAEVRVQTFTVAR